MKRMQLFEFEDQAWFPDGLRQLGTNYIVTFHRLIGSAGLLAPLLKRALAAGKTDELVDVCSGGGGPIPDVLEALRKDGVNVRATLTDLFPNASAIARIAAKGDPNLRYRPEPVDAGDVPASLRGVRTMVGSFHHMPPPVARRILEDAFKKRQPFVVFEISDNAFPNALWWLPLLVGPLMVLLLTPFMRPLTGKQLALTYLVPILPLFIAWDGCTSNARTYTLDDMRELLQGLEAPDYTWELGALTKKGYPGKFLYTLGLPR